MIVTCVHVCVKAESVEDFKKATVHNHEGSVLEPGNLRFDVLQSREDPTRFLLYEAYESDDAAREHKETGHYLQWRDAVQEMMQNPREGVVYDVVCPFEVSGW